MSGSSAKHRKSRAASARVHTPASHRKPSPVAVALQQAPARTAVTVSGAVLLAAAAAPAVLHLPAGTPHAAGPGQAAALSRSGAGPGIGAPGARPGHPRPAGLAGQAGQGRHRAPDSQSLEADRKSQGQRPGHGARPRHARRHPARPVYRNPLRDVSGLVAERIDQGVDFAGSGPIYAIGDAVVTNATGASMGWPGGGWITYRLTSGPGAGLTVYVAEDVQPAVSVGQTVTPRTVIATMYAGNDGIETGWAMASGFTAESQLPEAGGISGPGPFPTEVGVNFDGLLQELGVPAANNSQDYAYGYLPQQYPGDWTSARRPGR